MLDKKTFGQRIRTLRTKRTISQADLAKLLQVSCTQISDMERGQKTTSLERLVLLADYFGVSTDYLLGLTENPRRAE
ncbi:helix-turn-helix transcriptional regulator [uncultured Anaerotruncus sp.]|uniref:helix-turn-helix domain-containing protein n=1 Tax=uncultured Anaerotruncus sp. TaxID=905011 RepID=UPI00280BAFEA|nr:helix-turn-helix transcriptional regulator [uncultured Anaerotruncus sp.]